MKRGFTAIIIIVIVAVITVIGLIIISKTQIAPDIQSTQTQVRATQSLEINIVDSKEEIVRPLEATDVPSTQTVSTPTAVVTPQPIATQMPKATAVPIPHAPLSKSDKPQFNVKTNMNGFIYVSYKSDKKVKVMMDNNGENEIYDLIADGEFHRFTLHLGDGNYLVRLVENTKGKSYRVIKTVEFDCRIIDERFPYLVPNSFVVYENEMAVIEFGLALTEKDITDEEKAREIYDWIVRNVDYDFSVVGKLEVGYVPNPQRTYDSQLGICSDFASIFASLCRSQGIPCKISLGYYVKSVYYHAWNEVYINGEYVIVDASGDSQTGKYNFTRTDGYTKTKEH